MRYLRFYLLITIAVWPLPNVRAQEPTRLDTSRVYELETAIVTADRSTGVLANATASVSVLREAELERLPLAGLNDALASVPGFAFVNLDGSGYDPQAMIRGFYGGGETEYVVLLLNGKPLNQLARNLVNWNLIPVSGLSRVEVLRGGASSLYGDAAIGSVVNLVTDQSGTPITQFGLQGGSFGLVEGTLNHSGRVGARAYSVFGSGRRLNGFREHADRRALNLGASLDLLRRGETTVTASTFHYVRDYDVPGPLTQAELDEDRTQGSIFYRFDHTSERTHRLSLDAGTDLASSARFSTAFTGELCMADAITTLPLSPGFADTKNRETSARRLLNSTQLTLTDLPLNSRLIAGVDASLGGLDSDYYSFLIGPPEVYTGSSPSRGERERSGTASRVAGAGFVQLDLNPVAPLRLSIGARIDALSDTYTPDVPADEEETTSSNSAFSPKAGFNLRYVGTSRHVGNVYANVSRSFKAATLDQLYDQRTYPFSPDIPPITISNPELNPQTGTNVEAGLYHRTEFEPGRFAAEATLAVYQTDMKDELDFDFATLRYININESRHRGVEAGLKLYLGAAVTAFANYTYQGVTARSGPNEGKFVKAIPRDYIGVGFTGAHRSGLRGGLKLGSTHRIFLDDPNTIALPDFTTVDARFGYRYGMVGFSLEVYNLLDATYSTTGFPDPAGTGLVYFYPAAGRSIRMGLSVEL